MLNLLLQTTIEAAPDDWDITRFSRLGTFLSELRDGQGRPAFRVTARNRARRGEPDPVLSTLHESDFDQLWLFAVDTGDGLTPEDCAAIGEFWRRGGGLLATRDHMDVGSSLCNMGGIGDAHHFHSRNRERDEGRHCHDDPLSANISWPNYNSGSNGDFQRIRPVGSIHRVMRDRWSPTGVIQYLPAHPHEGAVSAPPGNASARAIMEGQSIVSGNRYNIAVAFERCEHRGRAIAQSTFHHFADYNWDPSAGCPSFVAEPPGDGMVRFPDALRSTKQYVRNVAAWLSA
ncbi:hypothetical protein ACL598_12325 [Bordetella bronchialis]|uniref:ThuA-like domain-containing protein n=1 Tax=Bordetella bronchialis TaxID=463025 RepID=A0A193FZ00_9BORD|nr:hypothetical protein [Bordetella bronchialis]ANN72214.1 hypothetical protein BAU08_13470 [Bordetella bronchialis]